MHELLRNIISPSLVPGRQNRCPSLEVCLPPNNPPANSHTGVPAPVVAIIASFDIYEWKLQPKTYTTI